MARGIAVIRACLARPEKVIALVTHGGLLSLMLKHYDPAFGFEDWRRLTDPDVYRLLADGNAGQASRVWTDLHD